MSYLMIGMNSPMKIHPGDLMYVDVVSPQIDCQQSLGLLSKVSKLTFNLMEERIIT